MKLIEVVEALSLKYGFNAEEATSYLRNKRRMSKGWKLKIVEPSTIHLKPILCKTKRRKSKNKRVSFEYGCSSKDEEPLVEYEAPLEIVESNEKYPLLCEK